MTQADPLRPAPLKTFNADRLSVRIFASRDLLGQAAAGDAAARMREQIEAKGKVVVVFASAPSQAEFLMHLKAERAIDWSKVTALHLDEYIGLHPDAPQGFGNFLRRNLFEQVKPAAVHFMDGNPRDAAAEAKRYARLLKDNAPDIACVGIGENGHLAFNDPSVADFRDPAAVKVVELEKRCREQQVHDGCFMELEDVPASALTMTIPAITAARFMYCMVPGPTKAQAVQSTVNGSIGADCPASILRTHENAVLYLDQESASLL